MARATRSALLAAGFFGVAALAGCSVGGPPPGGPGGDKGSMPPLKVTVSRPIVKTVTEFTDVTGSLKAVKRVEVRPQVSGYIKKVWFTDGAEVKEGDRLISIDPSLYKADLDKANGELASAQASAKLAGVEEARFSRLKTTSAVSQDEYDQKSAQKTVTEANVLTAKANVERAQQNLDWTEVKAPITGRVDRILVTEGNLVSGGNMSTTLLTVLTSTTPIYGYFDLDEQTVLYYLALINAGKFTSVRDKSLPIEFRLKNTKDDEGYPFKGELDFAATELNPATGSLTVRATIQNPPPYRFQAGMFLRARLPGAKVENAILVPDSAVVVDQADKVVYTVNAENKVVVNKVELGPLTEGLRVIAKGIKPDDRVVIRGVQRVQAGVPVEPEEGKIAPDGPKPAP